MEVIGLAGGIASGKSTVAAMFRDLGAVCLDADRLGHEVLLQVDVKARLRQLFGPEIFTPSGEVDRPRVAALVFGSDDSSRERLRRLESISHPRIGEQLATELQRLREAGCLAAVLDAAVMFKAGWDRCCTRIVFIRVPLAIRQARARLRGWSSQELAERESNQLAIEDKARQATDFLDNSTPNLDELRSQVRGLWKNWGLPFPE